jgi:hypothetical protein
LSFRIERTQYDAAEGTVTVEEVFRPGIWNYAERMRYTYTLHRKDEYWSIVDYAISNFVTR